MAAVQDTSPLKARILAAAAASASPTRRQARQGLHRLLTLVVAADAALFQLAGGLAHSRDRPIVSTAWLAGGWALASAGLTWLTVWLGTPLVREGEVLLMAAATTPLVLWGWMAHANAAAPQPHAARALVCFFATVAGAAAPFAAFLRARARGEPSQPGVLGAAGACSSAAWAGVLVLLWCPETERGHALAGHVAPLVVMTVLGAALGGRVLQMPGRRRLPVSGARASREARESRARSR
jgi:hypothetical protein